MNLSEFLIDALAAHRITRLVTTDDLTRPLRERVIVHAYGDEIEKKSEEVLGDADAWQEFDGPTDLAVSDETIPNLAKLILCPYCVSVYAGFGVMLARHLVPKAWRPVAYALAASAVVTLIPPEE